MSYSMIWGAGATTLEVKVKPFPSPRITPAFKWAQDSAGNWHVTDRGPTQDVYEAEVVVFGTSSEMESVADWIEGNARGQFPISAFSGSVFAPNVDHTAQILCTFQDLGRTKQIFSSPSSSPTLGIYELPVTLRAIFPTLLAGDASLEALRLQSGFEADKSTAVLKSFFQDTGLFASDDHGDSGKFVGTFRQREGDARDILRYFLGEGTRSEAFAFPDIGIEYPFGKVRGSWDSLQCRIRNFSVFRANLKVWEFKIEFVEEREIP